MEFLNSTTTGATVGSWLYRVATAPEYESSVLHAIGPGDVTVLGLGGRAIRLDRSYTIANIPVPTDPNIAIALSADSDPSRHPSRPAPSEPTGSALSSTSPSSLVAGLTQMARGAAEHLVASVVTSPRSPPAATAPVTTSVSTVTPTSTLLSHRSAPVQVPTRAGGGALRAHQPQRTESWAILDSDTADFISSYVANGHDPGTPAPRATPRANGAVSDSLANLALTESAIDDVGSWHHQVSYSPHTHRPSPPAAAASHLSGSPVFIPNLSGPRSSRAPPPLGGSTPPAAGPALSSPEVARNSPPSASWTMAARGVSGTRGASQTAGTAVLGKLSTSVISMPEDGDEDDHGFSDSDQSMSVITDLAGSSSGSSSHHCGRPAGATGAGGDTVVLDMMGSSAFAEEAGGGSSSSRGAKISWRHGPPPGHIVSMEDEGGANDETQFTLVTTIPGSTPPAPMAATVAQPAPRKASVDLDDFIHADDGDDDVGGHPIHHSPPCPPATQRALSTLVGTWHALPWFTYRTGLDHGTLRSDTGWGCMHRTVQMLAARAFLTCVFDPPPCVSARFRARERGYRAVMDMFVDNVVEEGTGGAAWAGVGAFALPKICDVGARQFGVRPGAWFSPTVAAQVMHRLNDRRRVSAGLRASSELAGGAATTVATAGGGGGGADDDAWLDVLAKHPLGNAVDLVTHVAMDGMVTPDPVVGKAYAVGEAPNGKPLVGGDRQADAGGGGRWRPLLLMVPVRLGLDEVGKQYVPSLVDVFTWPQFVGCAGGRKDASLYFAGTWIRPPMGGSSVVRLPDSARPFPTRNEPGNSQPRTAPPPSTIPTAVPSPEQNSMLSHTSLLFLDPHFPQPIPPPTTAVPNPSYHTSVIRALPMSRLDPCMLLGFLFRSHHDWDDFLERANAWDAQAALFSVPDGWSTLSRPSTADGHDRNKPRKRDEEGDGGHKRGNDGEDLMMPFGLDSGLLDHARVSQPSGSKLRQPTPSACRVDLKCRGPVPAQPWSATGDHMGDELVSPYVHIPPTGRPDGAGGGRAQHRASHHVPLR